MCTKMKPWINFKGKSHFWRKFCWLSKKALGLRWVRKCSGFKKKMKDSGPWFTNNQLNSLTNNNHLKLLSNHLSNLTTYPRCLKLLLGSPSTQSNWIRSIMSMIMTITKRPSHLNKNCIVNIRPPGQNLGQSPCQNPFQRSIPTTNNAPHKVLCRQTKNTEKLLEKSQISEAHMNWLDPNNFRLFSQHLPKLNRQYDLRTCRLSSCKTENAKFWSNPMIDWSLLGRRTLNTKIGINLSIRTSRIQGAVFRVLTKTDFWIYPVGYWGRTMTKSRLDRGWSHGMIMIIP